MTMKNAATNPARSEEPGTRPLAKAAGDPEFRLRQHLGSAEERVRRPKALIS
jgi:hypothetical protein